MFKRSLVLLSFVALCGVALCGSSSTRSVTGPSGPRGATGPTGPSGPTGPTGPTGVAPNSQSGTTYTFQSSDCGKVVEFTSGSAVTVTCPNSLAVDCAIGWEQAGAGQVTFSAGAGATINNRSSQTKSAGQWAMGQLHVYSNAGGSSAVYILGGDTGT